MRALVLDALGWACFAAAGLAMVVYAIHFAKRQGWRRPWNAAGLFFTAIALAQLPLFLHRGAENEGFVSCVLTVTCLLVAVVVQSVTALRTRRREDRRTGDAPPAAS